MNALDAVILGVTGVSIIYSTWKGFVRDAFSLVGLVGGFIVAARFYPVTAAWFRSWISSPVVASTVGFLLIFLVTYLACSFGGRVVRRGLRRLRILWMDRAAGFGLGLVKGIALCAGMLVLLRVFLPSDAALVGQSRLAPYVKGIAWELVNRIPGHLGERLRKDDSFWRDENRGARQGATEATGQRRR
ncbi:MAG: CvpA family protein [Thermodesulfobacteriota bacterium]